MLVYDVICRSDVNRAVLTSAVTIVDAVSRFQFIVFFFLLWGRSSPTKNSFFIFFFQTKILDQSRQSFNRNQNNEWLCAKFNMESLKVAIS